MPSQPCWKKIFLPLNKAKKFYLHAVKENNQSSIVEEVWSGSFLTLFLSLWVKQRFQK